MNLRMPFRHGPGPVFFWEMIRAARRWQMFAKRALFLGFLLAALLYVGKDVVIEPGPAESKGPPGEAIFVALVATQLILVMILAPAATAGAVCLEKNRGTLPLLLTTDLSVTEIVLGKLLSGLVPILGLVASSMPVLLLISFHGGIDPNAVIGAYLVTFGAALLTCCLAMTLSVWLDSFISVLAGTYVVVSVWSFPLPILSSEWASLINPFRVSGVLGDRAVNAIDLQDSLIFFGFALILSLLLISIMNWCFRDVALSQTAASKTRGKQSSSPAFDFSILPRPSLDGNPILWLACRPRKDSLFLLIGKAAFFLVGFYFCLKAASDDSNPSRWFIGLSTCLSLVPLVGLQMFVLCIRSSSAFEEDRTRNMPVLLSTPLSSREIVMGKWWSSLRGVWPLAIFPAWTACMFAFHSVFSPSWFLLIGLILVYGMAISSMGLKLSIDHTSNIKSVSLMLIIFVMINILPIFAIKYTEIIAMMSPAAGIGIMTDNIVRSQMAKYDVDSELYRFSTFSVIWMLVYLAIACLLLRSSVESFDRCMGRISENGVRPSHDQGR